MDNSVQVLTEGQKEVTAMELIVEGNTVKKPQESISASVSISSASSLLVSSSSANSCSSNWSLTSIENNNSLASQQCFKKQQTSNVISTGADILHFAAPQRSDAFEKMASTTKTPFESELMLDKSEEKVNVVLEREKNCCAYVEVVNQIIDSLEEPGGASKTRTNSASLNNGNNRKENDDDDDSVVELHNKEETILASSANAELFDCQLGDSDDLARASDDMSQENQRQQLQLDQLEQHQQPQEMPNSKLGRLERSNSCSQAELGAHASSVVVASGSLLEASENNFQQETTTSASHDNLADNKSILNQMPTLGTSASASNLVHQLTQSSNPLNSLPVTFQHQHQHQNQQANSNQDKQTNSSSSYSSPSSSSSRFFTSKLNTGSLWSLLSVGSNNSHTTEHSTVSFQHQDNLNMETKSQIEQQSGNDKSQSIASNLLSRVQSFKRTSNNSPLISNNTFSSNQNKPANNNSSSSSEDSSTATNQHLIKRFRFNNIKYIGSTILHKNFTLPMLEWIAKDIKRQSVRGAQSTSQRQFNFPARDIVFEIQSNFLIAVSARDGQPIFKHPMHCISKYAQLQHDQTSFSYLIRDTKNSPYYCHVFQAKSATKVHDIFKAIREAASSSLDKTSNSSCSTPTGSNQLQKSLSLSEGAHSKLSNAINRAELSRQSLDSGSNSLLTMPTTINPAVEQVERHNFEDSYQFEVMFVKKVKLQCRRVPASFVDDALETLKSFEVLKGGVVKESKTSQIKGTIGKRIISASVDERQEYDEVCQSPTPGSTNSTNPPQLSSINPANLRSKVDQTNTRITDEGGERRGSSISLYKRDKSPTESRSCQQSPTKVCEDSSSKNNKSTDEDENDEYQNDRSTKNQQQDDQQSASNIKKHQSMDCLKSIADMTIKTAKAGNAPNYSNDFSPYNTISSNDLNERIAAIPVVSTSSVSLDHETRQKLARQVRETIMATAASIKKDVYASGDKLDSSSSSKALDSLSCTVDSSTLTSNFDDQSYVNQSSLVSSSERILMMVETATSEQRRSSAGASVISPLVTKINNSNIQQNNNFDLFRRASARQVVKNRTMLLLIGKDELCAISIDKHQMLFSKSFSSIVLCLQGNNNKDHFGLICRDSGKINPQTESYAGFIFKCQSEKVTREIMAALKQVIYNSHHNQYHGISSPYNPLNKIHQQQQQFSNQRSPIKGTNQTSLIETQITNQSGGGGGGQQKIKSNSLAVKRGFLNLIDLDEAARQSAALDSTLSTTPPTGNISMQLAQNSPVVSSQPKSLIKSMFCDNCPLYWYHRLCCDIESLPGEVCKTLILRRIDNSLAEKEQDEIYSKFSEFNIETIDEHNTIFMSLLRHLSEKKQLKHSQTSSHQMAMAKISNSNGGHLSASLTGQGTSAGNSPGASTVNKTLHQRSGSGSTSGSLAFMLNQSSDASSAAIDNLKRAKNSISISIENMLKRRSSLKDPSEEIADSHQSLKQEPLARAGSFKARATSNASKEQPNSSTSSLNSLKRSQSTSDNSGEQHSSSGTFSSTLAFGNSLRDSLSRTINYTQPADSNPIVGLFRRRGSSFGSKGQELETSAANATNLGASSDCLLGNESSPCESGLVPSSPSVTAGRFPYPTAGVSPSSSTSSILSSVFWKKSIFDKVRRPTDSTVQQETFRDENNDSKTSPVVETVTTEPAKLNLSTRKSREELRALWRKAILEQITLIKMDKQNQKLLANAALCDIQRLKLNYRDVAYRRDVVLSWDKLLKQDASEKVQFADVARLVRAGVPKQRRGSVWMFLMNQYQLRHGTSFQPADSEYKGDANQSYRSLLSQLSLQQHDIFVDIGRTFPTHPYYSQYLSIGQLSLFNLLKAYSLLDQQVGYCQGLSFVAGILLLHLDNEDEAFELMRHLLFNFGLRKQYLPSMNALHLQLYQLTRLLRDHEFELFNHFDLYDISPSLYAAPWFLTLFASQFSLGFVSRLLDLVFLMGIEAIFRVSLNLLAYHRQGILSCTSLEATMDYMRSELVKTGDDKNLVNLFDKSMSLDLRNKLIEYEIEYTFYCAEDKARAIGKRGPKANIVSRNRNKQDEEYTKSQKIKNTTNHDGNVSLDQTTKNHETNISIEDRQEEDTSANNGLESSNTSMVADATATVIIQHLLANNHLKSLRTNYSY